MFFGYAVLSAVRCPSVHPFLLRVTRYISVLGGGSLIKLDKNNGMIFSHFYDDLSLAVTLQQVHLCSGVTRGGGGPPRVTPSRGVTPEGKIFWWENLQRIVEKRGRTVKTAPVWGDMHHGGGDTRVKAIKSDSDSDSDEQKKQVARFFRKK